jgi:hypothetical protein
MNIVTPNTGSVKFQVRTRPTQSVSPFKVVINLTNEETRSGSIISNVTASYDSNDFLNVTASMYLSGSNFYTIHIYQLSGSVQCNELYRGELYPTTESPTVINSEPFYSWTGSDDNYIIF